ncbi:MAG: hypothetical protein LBK83_04490 [Treponema sp.]|jgi:hypothetical protein|nr:hypothetical protein [Treponema sp.]
MNVKVKWARGLLFMAVLGLVSPFFGLFSQDIEVPEEEPMQPQTIPPELWRPGRGESPRFPIDTVIGELGRGEASEEAYRFAHSVAEALMAERSSDPSLSGMSQSELDGFFEAVREVGPESFRLGSGRLEPDGAVSFLLRFIGREKGITGELYIRTDEEPGLPAGDEPAAETTAGSGETETSAEEAAAAETAETAVAETAEAETVETVPAETAGVGEREGLARQAGDVWHFEDLLLEEVQERTAAGLEQRFDFSPYHRFF